MVPSVGAMFWVTSFISVVLPAPLRPTTPTRSPIPSSRSIPRKAQNSLKRAFLIDGRPSASFRFAPRELKILYIFPIFSRRIATSDIVDDDPFRSGEEPAAGDERHEREGDQRQGVIQARRDPEHDHLLVG